MSDKSNGGLGTVGALTLVFAVNKLTNAGDIAGWSWWWVLSPLWISFLFVVLVAAFAGGIRALTK